MLQMGLVHLQDPASRLHVREASTVLSMIRVIRKVSFGLRMHGLKYLYRAPVNEFIYPRLAATRALRLAVVSVTDKLSPGPGAGPRMVREGDKVWPMLNAGAAARRYVKSYLDKIAGRRLPLVISMRNYGCAPKRNSRTADWIAFADRCDRARFVPILCQTPRWRSQWSRRIWGDAACWNLEMRMALYETAWLNMGVMHGPLELCWLNENASYLIFISGGRRCQNSVQALNRTRLPRWRRSRLRGTSCREPDELARIEGTFSTFSRALPERPPA
jgi:hypothetical protein